MSQPSAAGDPATHTKAARRETFDAAGAAAIVVRAGHALVATTGSPFAEEFRRVFDAQFPRLFRYLDRLSGDPDLAGDIAQDTFFRLYRRGALPDAPDAWLISVAMNLFRNARSTAARRRRLLSRWTGRRTVADAAASPADDAAAEEERRRVRRVLDRLDERERSLLLLSAEGYSYRDMAKALELNEASVGTLLARARSAFRNSYGETDHGL